VNLARMVKCLDHDLCDRIINTSWEYSPARVLTRTGAKVDSIRSNSSASVIGGLEREAHDQINAALLNWSKLINSEYPDSVTKCLYLPGVKVDFDTWREAIGVLKYEQGEQYHWHVDQGVQANRDVECEARNRCISVVVYLNDDFKGGETEMLGRKYIPEKGKALIFPSNWNYPHRACPVEEGTKYALVTWFHPTN